MGNNQALVGYRILIDNGIVDPMDAEAFIFWAKLAECCEEKVDENEEKNRIPYTDQDP